jgi:hypothetical protein
LLSKEIKYSNLLNSSMVIGGEAVKAHIFSDSSDDTIQDAIKNNFMIYNMTECNSILKSFYNLTDDPVYLNSYYGGQLNSDGSDSYRLTAFTADSKMKLNLDLCQNLGMDIQMPINKKLFINLALFNELKDQGVDIFNKTDPAFTDRCFNLKFNGSDTTLSWRRQNLLQSSIPLCIGINCTYQGVNSHDYVECHCSGLDSDSEILNSVVDYVVDSVSQLNLGIIFCASLINIVSSYLI